MSALIALAGLATYVTQQPVEHDGQLHTIGSPIELDTAAAQALLDVGAIAHTDANAAQALQAAAARPAGAADERDQALQEVLAELVSATQQLENYQAHAAELQGQLTSQAEAHQAELQALRGEAETAGTKAAAALAEAAELRAQLESERAAQAELQDRLSKAEAAVTGTGKAKAR